MKKIPKEAIILVCAAVLICIMVAVVLISGKSGEASKENTAVTEPTTEEVADVEPIELPDKTSIKDVLGFEPAQVEKLSDKYVLRYVDIEEDGVVYSYQTHLAANGKRLYLKINKMTQEEYEASLPAESVREAVEIDGREAVFANRTLFKIPESENLDDYVTEQEMVNEGTAVIVRSDIDKERSEIQTLDWYENDCKYELYGDYMGFTKEEITELAHNYFANGE
jgi:hypothetical protein